MPPKKKAAGASQAKKKASGKKEIPEAKQVEKPVEDEQVDSEKVESDEHKKQNTEKSTRGRKKKTEETVKNGKAAMKKKHSEDEDSEKEEKDEAPPAKKAKGAASKAKKEKDVKNGKAAMKKKDSEDEDSEKEEKDEAPPAKKATGAASKAKKEKDDGVDKDAKEAKKEPINKMTTNLEEMDFGCEKVNTDGEKYNLKICSWNVAGIRAVIKKQGIEYLKKEDADIIVLQEIKCDSPKLPNEVKLPGYERYFLDSKKSAYCGVALYSKVKPIDVKFGIKNSDCNDEGRIITAEFENFYIVNVYVPNSGSKLVTLPKRMQWNKDFKNYMKTLDEKKPVIVCGDMNVSHQEIDLANPKTNQKNAGFTKEEREGMTDFLGESFVDTYRSLYPEKTGAYTFWSYFSNARARNIGWRLDYFLVSKRIFNKVCDNIIRDKVYGSDHCPIILYANL